MAAVSRSRRAASGIAFIVAGALFVIAILLPYLNLSLNWVLLLAYAATAVAFVILGLGAVNSTLAKVLLIVAAVGWALLALLGLGLSMPAIITTLAALAAGVGGLVAAIVMYVGKEITNTPALIFIVATALGLLYLLGVIGTIPLGSLAPVVAVLFGVALIVTGFLFRRTERGRR
jgi:hypothetical protein